ncbi:MAG: 50S ribosomal protein L11 methyltransferase [Cyclobacteriaceae bacterium]
MPQILASISPMLNHLLAVITNTLEYIKISIFCLPEYTDMLSARLLGLNYEAFEETEYGVDAYVEENIFDQKELREVVHFFDESIKFETEKVENINWNQKWESSFEPVIIENKVKVRASFQNKDNSLPYDIVIDPKMSFGTGHHETTSLMIKNLLNLPVEGKQVLDLGTGTGILSIMAHKLKAKKVLATDIEEWSLKNSHENFELNQIFDIEVLQGTIEELKITQKFDIILANITKNILLAEMEHYVKLMNPGGYLLLSGFYKHDVPDLKSKAESLGLSFLVLDEKTSWSSLLFRL